MKRHCSTACSRTGLCLTILVVALYARPLYAQKFSDALKSANANIEGLTQKLITERESLKKAMSRQDNDRRDAAERKKRDADKRKEEQRKQEQEAAQEREEKMRKAKEQMDISKLRQDLEIQFVDLEGKKKQLAALQSQLGDAKDEVEDQRETLANRREALDTQLMVFSLERDLLEEQKEKLRVELGQLAAEKEKQEANSWKWIAAGAVGFLSFIKELSSVLKELVAWVSGGKRTNFETPG